ncbi:MAG: hypothetical protein ACRDS9_11835, partial [Pseudonocardiaceae bacterium]
MPPTIEAATRDLPARRAKLLRAWGENLRRKQRDGVPLGQPATWNDESPTALRQIAAGMAVLSERPGTFGGADYALFSGLPETKSLKEHQNAFQQMVDTYLDQVRPYTEVGTAGPGKPLADPDDDNSSGDYDFPLRDIVAILHIFLDRPDVLSNGMIRKLIGQKELTFSDVDGTATGTVPFSGQNLDEWLGAGPGGRHFFIERAHVEGFPLDLVLPDPGIKIATQETENHLLGIWAWRFLVNEYLTFVSRLQPGDPHFHRFDLCLKSLVESDPDRYVNRPETFDFVLQLLGRIPHSGMYESNAKPYGAYAIGPVLAFYQAADRLFPDDPERQKIKTAARNALDYLAAEFAFQSFEGKRVAPFRRNYDHRVDANFYNSDYVPHLFGVLTGAFVFPDGEDGPFHWTNLGQEGGFALWALLSEYTVPRSVHD